jgi:hypothetical protein
MKKINFILILSFLTFFAVQGQNKLVEEWEINLGYLNVQGDFGERGTFSTTLGNSGVLVGTKVFFNLLDPNRSDCYSCKHLKFNLNFNSGYSNLGFNSKYKKINPDNINYKKVLALNGSLFFVNLGANMEFHLKDLKRVDVKNIFNSFIDKLDPYVGVGLSVNYYSSKVNSDLGNFELNPAILPDGFAGRIYSEPGIVPSTNIEVGLRFLVSNEIQLNINNKWIYFISDKVDGLVPDPEIVENKHDDWLFSPSFGVVIFIEDKE